MQLWTAFLLGLFGSLHCLGMCGPLILAIPYSAAGGSPYVGRLLYHSGRIATYALLGALFGLVGATLGFAGLQRWTTLAAGSAVLIGLAASSPLGMKVPAFQLVRWLKSAFAHQLHQRTRISQFFLGAINGLLPCGLVYAAGAAATASGDFFAAIEYMIVFGLGTLPMMLGLAFAGGKVKLFLGGKLPKLIPATLALLGLLLLCRGLSLGIPYLSPTLSGGSVKCAACSR